jgi:hypothetical protein
MNSKHCDLMVPEGMLSMPDSEGSEGMAMPGEGDSVTLTIEANVTGTKDGQAMLKISTINGEPYKGESEEDGEMAMDEDGDPTMESLEKRTKALDNAPV